MPRLLARLLTLRRVGIAGAFAGVVALAAPFASAAWKWFWPDPGAKILWPEHDHALAGCFDIGGSLVPDTFWRRPLWLIAARDWRGWQPLTRIAPWTQEWNYRACVHGQTGDRNQFALVVADSDRDEAFARALVEPPEEEIPDWLTRRNTDEQVPGCPGRRHGFDPLPAGATLVDMVQVRVRWGDRRPCGSFPFRADDSWPSGADEGQGRRRHAEGRGLRGHRGLQRAGVRYGRSR